MLLAVNNQVDYSGFGFDADALPAVKRQRGQLVPRQLVDVFTHKPESGREAAKSKTRNFTDFATGLAKLILELSAKDRCAGESLGWDFFNDQQLRMVDAEPDLYVLIGLDVRQLAK